MDDTSCKVLIVKHRTVINQFTRLRENKRRQTTLKPRQPKVRGKMLHEQTLRAVITTFLKCAWETYCSNMK